MSATESAGNQQDATPRGITEIAVQGFKSLYEEQRIAVRPLTILAGANNSGKSSIMQPLLMMKQTLDATYDPGPLKLDGPNVYFTSAEQFLSRQPEDGAPFIQVVGDKFTIGLKVQGGESMTSTLQYREGRGIDIFELQTSTWPPFPLRPEMDIYGDDIDENMRESMPEEIVGVPLRKGTRIDRIMTSRNRCFLVLTVYLATQALIDYTLFTPFQQCVSLVIHVPALRGNPRTHGTTGTAFDLLFPHRYEGTFEHYVASIIESWQDKRDDHLEKLGRDLELLGLTWRIRAVRLNDVEIELRAARLPRAQGGAGDPVNIADMGVGVSQVLPALVALLTAIPGQLVYLEHPERDLHPRAQVALAKLLADAAQRGVRVVVETHSSLLLLGVQTLVAKGTLPPDQVALHWFKRDNDGATTVTSADLDEAGAFGDWPEDFGDVELKSESRYLDAAESVLWKRARAS